MRVASLSGLCLKRTAKFCVMSGLYQGFNWYLMTLKLPYSRNVSDWQSPLCCLDSTIPAGHSISSISETGSIQKVVCELKIWSPIFARRTDRQLELSWAPIKAYNATELLILTHLRPGSHKTEDGTLFHLYVWRRKEGTPLKNEKHRMFNSPWFVIKR